MARRCWRAVDVDLTLALPAGPQETLQYGVNQPLIDALVATHRENVTETFEFSSCDAAQAEHPQGSSHVAEDRQRLRFLQALVQAGCPTLGLVCSASDLMPEQLFAYGRCMLANEKQCSDAALKQNYAGDMGAYVATDFPKLDTPEHLDFVKRDIFWGLLKGHLIRKLLEQKSGGRFTTIRDFLDNVNLHENFEQEAVYLNGLIKEYLYPRFESGFANLNAFKVSFLEWADQQETKELVFLVLDFFNHIVWPAEMSDQIKRKIFLSGKGDMFAHMLRHIPESDVIQVFDDKSEVIKFANILINPDNQSILGQRKLVVLQVNNEKNYHHLDFYSQVMEHTECSRIWYVEEAEAAYLDFQIKRGMWNASDGNVVAWESCSEVECVAAITAYMGSARYVICPLDDGKTVVLYDALHENYYRYYHPKVKQHEYVEHMSSNPQQFAPNHLVQRLNRSWEKAFSLPHGPIVARCERWLHYYLGIPSKNDAWYSKAGYALGGFVITPVINFLKLPLQMLPRGMECVLESAIDAVDAKQWPTIIKFLIEAPLYLGLAPIKTSRLILGAVLSPIVALRSTKRAFLKYVWEPAVRKAELKEREENSASASASSGCGLFARISPDIISCTSNQLIV